MYHLGMVGASLSGARGGNSSLCALCSGGEKVGVCDQAERSWWVYNQWQDECSCVDDGQEREAKLVLAFEARVVRTRTSSFAHVQPPARMLEQELGLMSVPELLGRADALYQEGRRKESLRCFDEAIFAAKSESGADMVELALIGKGFALANGSPSPIEVAEGVSCLEEAKTMAKMDVQKSFIDKLIFDLKRKCEAGGEHAACQSKGGFLGLGRDEELLIELVAKEGAGNWTTKAARLAEFGHSGADLERIWKSIAPSVKEKLVSQPDMPCGHTCGTCPTRSSCHLHDVLDDMEDMFAVASSG